MKCKSGIFQPIIAYDGKICGNWSPFKEDFQASFFEENFEPVDVSEAWQSYNSYRNKYHEYRRLSRVLPVIRQ